MATQRAGDLDLSQDLAFNRREWRVQRIGWALMVVVVLAALLGLLGRGPVSHATTGPADAPLRIEYQRIDRSRYPTELTLVVAPGTDAGQVEIWIASSFLDAIRLEQTVPQATEERIVGDGVVFVFAVDDLAGTGRILLRFEHDRAGLVTLEAGLAGGPAHHARMLVLP